MYWVGGVFLQLLTQFQDVVVDGSGRGVIVVSPNLVQQFIARDNPLRVLQQEFQRLELLSCKGNSLSLADHFHFADIDVNIVEGKLLAQLGLDRAPQGSANT